MESRSVPMDGGWAWCVAFASFGVHFAVGSLVKTFGILVPEYKERFQCSAWAINSVQGTYFALWLGLAPISNALATRFTTRKVLVSAGLVGTAGFIGSALSTTLPWFFFFQGIVVGTGFGLCYGPCVVMIVYFFEERRGLAMSIAHAGHGVGGVIMPVVTGYLMDTYGRFGTVLIQAGIMAQICVCGMLVRPMSFYNRENETFERELDTLTDTDAVCYNKNTEITCPRNLDLSHAHMEVCENTEMCVILGESDIVSSDLETVTPEYLQRHGNIQMSEIIRDRNVTVGEHTETTESTSSSVCSSVVQMNIMFDGGCREKASEEDVSLSTNENAEAIHLNLDTSNNCEERTVLIKSNNVNTVTVESGMKDHRSEDSYEPNDKIYFRAIRSCMHQFDCSIFRNPLFVVYTIGAITVDMTWESGFYLIPFLSKQHDFSLTQSSWLMTMHGSADFIIRLLIGPFTDLKLVPRKYIFTGSVFGIGITAACAPFVYTYAGLAVCAVCYGIGGGAMIPLAVLVLADVLRSDQCSSAYGLLFFCEAFGAIITAQITGWLYDISGSWHSAFWFTAAVAIVGGITTCTEPFIRKFGRKTPRTEVDGRG